VLRWIAVDRYFPISSTVYVCGHPTVLFLTIIPLMFWCLLPIIQAGNYLCAMCSSIIALTLCAVAGGSAVTSVLIFAFVVFIGGSSSSNGVIEDIGCCVTSEGCVQY